MRKIFAILTVFCMICLQAQARKVSGRVTSGDEKLHGVVVTDGRNFTLTGKNGRFSFEIDDYAEFVYIVTPSGYVADYSSGSPAFYQEAENRKRFVFDLLPTDKSGDYTLIAIADPQFKTDGHFAQFAGAPVADLCKTAEGLEGTAVGIVLGDICYDSFELWDRYKKEIVRTGIPVYPVPGNHDHDLSAKGDINTTGAYRKLFGPENYAFFIGDDVVIILDNIIYDTRKKYEEGYADHVFAWIKNLLPLLPSDAGLYIAQHSPLKLLRRGKTILGASEMLELLQGRKVTFLSGHEHINNIMDHGNGILEHNVAALCGAWWDAPHCTDGTPQGYKVFTKTGGKTRWYYKSVGHPADHQIELYGCGRAPLHPDSVVVNVWDWDPEWKVEWFEDGRPMGELEPVYECSPVYIAEINAAFEGEEIPEHKKAIQNYHYFAATPNPEAKTVTVSVESRFHQKWIFDVNLAD